MKVNKNQKERAIGLLAFHGYLLAQVATNTDVRSYLASTDHFLGLGSDVANVVMTIMYFLVPASGALFAYLALSLAGSSELDDAVEAEKDIARSFAICALLLVIIMAFVAYNVRAASKAEVEVEPPTVVKTP